MSARDSELLEVGQLVEIEVGRLLTSTRYTSRVEDTDRRGFVVSDPQHGQGRELRPGERVRVRFLRTRGPGEGRYEGDAEVKERLLLRGEVAAVRLSWPRAWKKTQRREFARIGAVLPVNVRLDSEEQGPGPWHRLETLNVSGSGLLLHVPEELPTGAEVEVELFLPRTSVRARGQIVRVSPQEDAQDPTVAGVQFTHIDSRDQDAIVQFVFRRQLEMRKKGLV